MFISPAIRLPQWHSRVKSAAERDALRLYQKGSSRLTRATLKARLFLLPVLASQIEHIMIQRRGAMKRAASIERVALYARVSTKDGRQDTENQLVALRQYCAKQGWEIVGEFVDHETGGHSRRPHFQQMFADARQHLSHELGAAHGPLDARLPGWAPRHEHHETLRSPAGADDSLSDGSGGSGKGWAYFSAYRPGSQIGKYGNLWSNCLGL
jgi:hypothetical protein